MMMACINLLFASKELIYWWYKELWSKHIHVSHIVVNSGRRIQHYVVQYTLCAGSWSTTNFIYLSAHYKRMESTFRLNVSNKKINAKTKKIRNHLMDDDFQHEKRMWLKIFKMLMKIRWCKQEEIMKGRSYFLYVLSSQSIPYIYKRLQKMD